MFRVPVAGLVASVLAVVAVAALAGCASAAPSRVTYHHGLGGSSLVYVEPLGTEATRRAGRAFDTPDSEIAARFRSRLFLRLRDQGMQTRDGAGRIPTDGILVRGTLDTVDGGSDSGLKLGGQRVHCTIQLWNGDESRSEPAYELQITGSPALGDVMTDAAGILGAAEDAADQVARYIRDHP